MRRLSEVNPVSFSSFGIGNTGMPDYQPRVAHEVELKLTDRERELIRIAVAEAVAVIKTSFPEQPKLPPVAPLVRRLNVNSAHGRLSTSESRVLELLLAGHSNKTTAEVLSISPRTVEVHRRRAMERLGVKQLTEVWLLAYAGEVGRRESPQPSESIAPPKAPHEAHGSRREPDCTPDAEE